MHRCLALPEILSNVFDFAYWEHNPHFPNQSPTKNTQCLLNLALTCKTFYEPALTTLWSYQSSLVPLVCCLPSDAYCVERLDGSDGFYRSLNLCRDLLPSDFDRLRLYAKKIKHLNICSTSEILSPQTIALFLLHRAELGDPLLPKIRHLIVKEDSFIGAATLPRLVLGPFLESVHLKLGDNDHGGSRDNIKTILFPYASKLISFTIQFDRRPPRMHIPQSCSYLNQLFSKFCDLKSFQSQGIKLNSDAINCISTLPMLHKQDLHLVDIDLSSINRLPFHHLTDLKLVATTMTSITAFLSSASFKNLRKICIFRDWSQDEETDWDFQIFSEVLSSCHRKCPLVYIQLLIASPAWRISDSTPEMPITITRSNIQPLFVFPNISAFKIFGCYIMHLDDALLVDLSRAWPKLRNLELQDFDCRNPSLTPPGVISFARSCPKLESLTLCFDAQDIPHYARFDALSSPPSHLKRLDVCCSPISDAHSVALCLILAFPYLQELDFYAKEWADIEILEAPNGEWVKVHSYLQEILLSRRGSLVHH